MDYTYMFLKSRLFPPSVRRWTLRRFVRLDIVSGTAVGRGCSCPFDTVNSLLSALDPEFGSSLSALILEYVTREQFFVYYLGLWEWASHTSTIP